MSDLDFGIGASGKVQAFLLFALAIFMSALACGILGSPMNMHPVLGFLLKAFIGLVFGGIAAMCILMAVRSVRRGPKLPPEVFAYCLTCGERTPHDLVCPVCAEPPQDRTAVIRINSDDILGQMFGALIAIGVGCLGLFIMIGPYFDGERRWWALIAFFALGLGMFVIGVVGFFGLMGALWNRAKGAKTISFSCHAPDRSTQGNGQIAWGKLRYWQGKGQINTPLTARGHSEGGYRVSPGDMSLAEAIATFDAAGLIEIVDLTTHQWSVGDPSGKTRSQELDFQRTTTRRSIVKLSSATIPYSGDEDADEDDGSSPEPRPISEFSDEAITRYLARYLYPLQSLGEFKTKVDADPVHRTQLEMHARVLRDRGIVVANELVDAVVEGLLRENQKSG